MSNTFPGIPSPPEDRGELTSPPTPPAPQDRVDGPSPVPPPPPPPIPPPTGPYQPAPPYMPPRQTVAGFAVASMVLGILWIYWIGSILAVIFGHIALSQIKRANGWKTGRGMAIAGVVLGWIGVVTLPLFIIAAIVTADEDDAAPATDNARGLEDDSGALDGAYQVDWTTSDLVAAGVPESAVRDLAMAGTFTWTFDDGDLAFLGVFPDGTILRCDGSYTVTDERLALQRYAPCVPWRFTSTWKLTDRGLVLTDALLDGQPQPLLDVWMCQKPWREIRG